MRQRRIPGIAFLIMTALCATLDAQTVSLSLSSPQNGVTVPPGTPINWSITFTVSSGNNAGLALLIVDLVQAAANPSKFDILPANAVPASMSKFSRPSGISNPGEANPVTGYVGVQRGPSGQKDLRQIGGAQNTFGRTRPAGSGIAENANVTGGVGQFGSVTLASGMFAAPSANGTYTLHLEDAIANVLTAVNQPPQHSPVTPANVNLASASFGFTVIGAACTACDVNCDNQTDGSDVQRFVAALLPSPPAPCSLCAGDVNASGDVSQADIAPFVACLLGA